MRRSDKEITDLETIQVCERTGLCAAMPGKYDVPAPTWRRRAGPVSDPLIDHRQGDPGTYLFIDANRWDSKVGDHHTRLLARG